MTRLRPPSGTSGSGASTALTPTATKTAAYTAAVGDLAMMNVAGGGTTLTLPTAPADKAQVGYRAIGATAAVPLTVTAGAGDTIGTTGATSASIPLADEVAVLQYQAASTRWLAVANVKTQASLDSRYPAADRNGRLSAKVSRPGVFGGSLPVMTYGGVFSGSNPAVNGNAGGGATGTTTGYTSRQPSIAAVACTDLRVVYPGWYVANAATSESAAPNNMFVKCAIEVGGVTYPVNFAGGGRLATIEPWATVVSEPLGIELAAGDTFYVRTFFDTPAGGSYLLGTNLGAAPGTTGWYQTGDQTDATGTLTNGSSSQMMVPLAVLGTHLTTTPSPVVVGIGDSLTIGHYDGGATIAMPGRGGYLARALGNLGLPGLAIGLSGVMTSMWANKLKQQRVGPFMGMGTTAVVLSGTNDIPTRSLAATQTDLLTVYTRMRARGMRVVAVTLPPRTTSTDNWTTTTGQTPVNTEATRVALNDWIRTVPTGADAVADLADQVESSRNSGLWKPGYCYTDGVHMNATGAAAGAACLTLPIITG